MRIWGERFFVLTAGSKEFLYSLLPPCVGLNALDPYLGPLRKDKLNYFNWVISIEGASAREGRGN